MAINKGNIKTSANYDVRMQASLDGRRERPTKTDLITKSSWSFDGNTVYVYEGMPVYVKDEKRTYILNDVNKMFDADYSGWDLVITGNHNSIEVDSVLNEESANPIQNAAVTKALNEKTGEIYDVIRENKETASATFNTLNEKVNSKTGQILLYYFFGQRELTEEEKTINAESIELFKNNGTDTIVLTDGTYTYIALEYGISEETFFVTVPSTTLLSEHTVFYGTDGTILNKTITNGGILTLKDTDINQEEVNVNVLLFKGNLVNNTGFKCLREDAILSPVRVKERVSAEDLIITYEIVIQNGKNIETWCLSENGSVVLLSSEEIGTGTGSGEEGNIILDLAMSDTSENGVQNKVIKQYVDKGLKQNVNKITENTKAITALTETVNTNTELLQTLNGTEEGSIDYKIQETKNIIDSYSVNGKSVSANPILESDDITISNTFSTLQPNDGHVVPGDFITDAISKIEIMLANTTLALTAALNDLESRIGEPSSYDTEGNKIEGRGLYKLYEDLQEQINNLK